MSWVLKLALSRANREPRIGTHTIVLNEELGHALLFGCFAEFVRLSLTHRRGKDPENGNQQKRTDDANKPACERRQNDFPRLPSCRSLGQVLTVEIDFDVASHVLEVIPCAAYQLCDAGVKGRQLR